MVDFPHGLPGDPAVSPVEKAPKRGVVCAVTPFQPTAGSFAKDQIQKHETVNRSCVQWMVVGQNGALGKNALGAADVATEPGPEVVIIPQLSMAAGRVKGMPWK